MELFRVGMTRTESLLGGRMIELTCFTELYTLRSDGVQQRGPVAHVPPF